MKPKRISAAEAKTNLSELLSRVAYGGERFVIERRGKPVAALVSVDEVDAPPEAGEGDRVRT
jgi:prevent-host-death family protein